MNRLAIVLLLALCVCGCANMGGPSSFSKVAAPGWVSMEIREGVGYDHAWNMVYGILVTNFDIDFASKDDGYLRTDWTYTWNGAYQKNYRVRVTAKFADDRKTIAVKSEAQFQPAGAIDTWVIGVDSRLLTTLKTDLMGTIGRTTR